MPVPTTSRPINGHILAAVNLGSRPFSIGDPRHLKVRYVTTDGHYMALVGGLWYFIHEDYVTAPEQKFWVPVPG